MLKKDLPTGFKVFGWILSILGGIAVVFILILIPGLLQGRVYLPSFFISTGLALSQLLTGIYLLKGSPTVKKIAIILLIFAVIDGFFILIVPAQATLTASAWFGFALRVSAAFYVLTGNTTKEYFASLKE